jgi:beta-phosphoglucomutase-like phosphatase (HAD superfamily)
LIRAGELGVFPDAIRFTMNVRAQGLRIAVASSPKNANRTCSGVEDAPPGIRTARAAAMATLGAPGIAM